MKKNIYILILLFFCFSLYSQNTNKLSINQKVPCVFDSVRNFKNGIAKVKKDGKWGLINYNGERITDFLYDYENISKINDSLEIKENELIKSNNSNSSFANQSQYHKVKKINDSLIIIQKDNKKGIIDKNGNEIIQPKYEKLDFDYRTNFVYLKMKNDKNIVVMDLNGKLIKSITCKELVCFPNGLSWVWTLDSKNELLNSKNEMINNNIQDYGILKNDWLVFKSNELWGFFKNDKKITSFQYFSVGDFSEGLAYAVLKGGKTGYIDENGKEVIPYMYDWDGSQTHENIKYHFNEFSEGLVGVSKNAKYGFIDKSNKTIIPFIYENVGKFKNGFAKVKKDGKWGFVNKNGEMAFPFEFDYADDFIGEFARVVKNGKEGFLSLN